MSKVYLAGAIAGLTEHEARDWREHFANRLREHGVIAISPLRCEKAKGAKFDDAPHLTDAFKREILAKNLYDVRNTDITLAYLPLPTTGQRPSYGTMWEVGAARVLGKPVIIVSNDPVIRAHPLFGGTSDWLLDTLEEAAEVCIGILKDHTPQPIYFGMDLARAEGLRNSPEAPF